MLFHEVILKFSWNLLQLSQKLRLTNCPIKLSRTTTTYSILLQWTNARFLRSLALGDINMNFKVRKKKKKNDKNHLKKTRKMFPHNYLVMPYQSQIICWCKVNNFFSINYSMRPSNTATNNILSSISLLCNKHPTLEN